MLPTGECIAAVCDDYASAVLSEWTYKPDKCCEANPKCSDPKTCVLNEGSPNEERWSLVPEEPGKEEPGKDGFSAATFKKTNPDGSIDIVIAYRGTEPTDVGDLATDLGVITRLDDGTQYAEAKNYYEDQRLYWQKYQEEHPGEKVNISVTGHSLGGSLALYIGGMFGVPTTTFNPLGLNASQMQEIGQRNTDNIVNYVHEDDLVRCANSTFKLDVPGKIIEENYGHGSWVDWCNLIQTNLIACVAEPSKVTCAPLIAEVAPMIFKHLIGGMREELGNQCAAHPGSNPGVVPSIPNAWEFWETGGSGRGGAE